MMGDSMPSVDVLIVGAGPAGCAAAIRAASHGLTVALVEKTRFPRDVPGEALHPDVDRIFDQLGVTEAVSDAGFLRYPGWMREHAGERTFVPFLGEGGFRFGYQAWRSTLDSILLAHAQRAGVRVEQTAGRSEPIAVAGRVIGMRVADRTFSCRHLVDASGTTRWLSRKMGLRVARLSPALVAGYGYVSGDSDLGIIPEFREHACGWTWLARVRDDCCQVVRLSLVADADPPPPPAPFDRLTALRGADVTWRVVPACAGAGYFLCGDAAASLDPAAPSGVARALAAGIKTADLIARVSSGEMTEEDGAAAYREWLGREVGTQALQAAACYASLENPPEWLDALPARWRDAGLSRAGLESFRRSDLRYGDSAYS